MNHEMMPLHDETAHQRKIATIKQTIAAYVQGDPGTEVFNFFLPSTQDLDLIKQAAASTSLSTGKRITLLYPCEMTSTGIHQGNASSEEMTRER